MCKYMYVFVCVCICVVYIQCVARLAYNMQVKHSRNVGHFGYFGTNLIWTICQVMLFSQLLIVFGLVGITI